MQAFVEMLQQTVAPAGCANPYTIHEQGIDHNAAAPQIRAAQLHSYLARRQRSADLLLVAEAPGYQGARFSGIAMTCERTLLGKKDGVPAHLVLGPGVTGQRTSDANCARNAPERASGFNEPTASIVWRALISHNLDQRVILWNVFPFHPRKGGPLSNRTPSRDEVLGHLHVLHALHAQVPGCRVVCIGNTARDHLSAFYPDAPTLRHPANGGARAFRAGLAEVAASAR